MKKKFLLEEALGGDMSEYSDKDWKKLKATREGTRIHVEGGIEPRKIYEVVIEPSLDNVRHIVGVDSFGSLAVFHGLAQRVEGVDPVHV